MVGNLVNGMSIIDAFSSDNINDVFLSNNVSIYSFVKVHQVKEIPSIS